MSFKKLSSFIACYETVEGDDFNINQPILKQKRENFEGQMYARRHLKLQQPIRLRQVEKNGLDPNLQFFIS